MGILSTVIKEATPKAVKRTLAKDVLDVELFSKVRTKDIGKEQQRAYLKGEELKTKQESFEQKINNEEYNSKIEERKAKLEEQRANLYLEAQRLKLEKKATKNYEKQRAEGLSPNDAIKNIISEKTGVQSPFSSPEARGKAIYNRVSAEMFDLKDELRTKWAGLWRNEDLGDDVIRMLKDGKVKNEANLEVAKKIADQWGSAANKLKALRAKAGGRVGKLEDWVMPQTHEKNKIKKAGYAKWRETILPKLDVKRIEEQQNSKIEDILASAYKNITARDVESGFGQASNLAKRGRESRVLHFKDGDSIIEYNKQFGSQDVYASMDAHMRVQSTEIGTMQVFGGNPELTLKNIIELAKKDGLEDYQLKNIERIWNVVSGKADGDNIVGKVDATLAGLGSGFRSISISSKLGSATISSIADVGNIFLGAGYRGLNGFKIFGKGLHTLLQEATSGMKTSELHEFANRIGVISEFANASLSNSRFAEQGSGWLANRAENVIRASGLGSWTDSLRTGFGLEVNGNMASSFGKEFEDLSFKNMLSEAGVTPAEWDIIRKTKPKDLKGAKFLDIAEVYKIDEDLGYKISEMITSEMDAFILMPNARMRAISTGGAKKGTIQGEVTRNMMLFKSYPITVMALHLNRMGTMTTGGKLAYGAKTMVYTTVFGAVALWAHDIVTGKTPRSLDRKEMVFESIMKGGAMGIFADLLLDPSANRYGNSWTSTLMGVPASAIEDLGKTVIDFTRANPKAVANAYNRAKNYIPGQNLWYTRLAIEKTIGRVMGEMLDPDYAKKKRKHKKAMRLRSQKDLF